MILSVLAVLSISGGAVFAAPLPQQGGGIWSETRFHRIQLKNGNFIDGKLISQNDREVVLRLGGGEIAVRWDLIDRVELVSMKGLSDKARLVERGKQLPPPPPAPPAPPTAPTAPPTGVDPNGPPHPSEAPNLAPELRRKIEDTISRAGTQSGEDKWKTLMTLHELGENACVWLACRLGEMDGKTLETAAEAVAYQRWAKSHPYLIRQLLNSRQDIRRLAARSLGQWGDKNAAPGLAKAMKDSDDLVRAEAVTAWTLVRPQNAIPPLAEAILDPSQHVRTRALQGFLELADAGGNFDDALSRLDDTLARASEDAQVRALQVLGGSGRKPFWKLVVNMTRNPELQVRYAAVGAIISLEAPESGPAVVEMIRRETDRGMRIQLVSAARALKVLAAVDPLIDWLDQPDVQVQTAAIHGLVALTGADLGRDKKAWQDWWAKNRPKSP
jgi:HEAT repeat protein